MSICTLKNVLKNEFENKMISSGNNYPKVNLNENNLKEICIMLHHKFPNSVIKEHYQWSEDDLNHRLQLLLEEELIETKNGKLVPNFMVITLKDGNKLYQQLHGIDNKIVDLIIYKLNLIKIETAKLDCFKKFTFDEISLLILSNVLLDAIQIDNVEELFLKSERKRRNGMNYYYSIQEKYKDKKTEALGIYGNMFRYYGKIAFGLYGNQRNEINFHTIDKTYIENYLDKVNENSIGDIKKFLLDELLKLFYNKEYKIKNRTISFFNQLGIMNNNLINIPVLSKNEFIKLNNIAEVIKTDLINILQEHKENIYQSYCNSVYFNETSFEEYFIWWYHLLYSKVTDLLIERGEITVPKEGNSSYIVF